MAVPLPSITLAETPRRRRPTGLLLVAALLAGGLSTFILPATSASAEAIDCGYTPGLSEYIGAGRDGVTCMGGGTHGPGTVYGSGHLPGQTVPGGSTAGSACNYSAPALPDAFYGWGNVSTSTTSFDHTRDDGTLWHSTRTMYSRNGHYVASRQINTSLGKPLEVNFNDFTLIEGRVLLTMTFNCKTDPTWVVDEPTIFHPDENVAPTPGAPATASRSLDTRASMAPVPFHPGKYFLRVDLTNNHPAPSVTGFSMSLDLSSYSLDEIITSPRDSSCPEALTFAELCVSPAISPGETQTFTAVVSARAGVSATAPITVLTSHDGWRKIGPVNRPGEKLTLTTVAPG
ncbi:hypothetical protein [Subtercola boreus]|nr:hypothetical protein [Subtercola boreus]